MFKGQHHESRKSLSLSLTLEHAYCKKSQLLRGTFCFTQVQGPNALTTLLHLADELVPEGIRNKQCNTSFLFLIFLNLFFILSFALSLTGHARNSTECEVLSSSKTAVFMEWWFEHIWTIDWVGKVCSMPGILSEIPGLQPGTTV